MGLSNFEIEVIEAFATYSFNELKENNWKRLIDALNVTHHDELLKNDEYLDCFYYLEPLRKTLDSIINSPDKNKQVKKILLLIELEIKSGLSKKIEILIKLIQRGPYVKTWKKKEKANYDKGLAMLTIWKDFFFSYTNQNCIRTNNDFKAILKTQYGRKFMENCESKNYVARLLVEYLNDHHLSSFYDKDSLTSGDDILDKIFDNCQSVFTFVQLIEIKAFQMKLQNTSWCFKEFKAFTDWCVKEQQTKHSRYHFFLTDSHSAVIPENIPLAYKDWKEQIERTQHTDLSKFKNNKEIECAVRDIAKKIIDMKKMIINDYIDSL